MEKEDLPLGSKILSKNTSLDFDVLRARVAEKEERLRKLKLVEMYKKKWSKDDLSNRALEWRNVAQRAFMELFNKYKEGPHPDLTIEKCLHLMNIKPEFIGFNVEDEAFED